jgi:hypothetical protein
VSNPGAQPEQGVRLVGMEGHGQLFPENGADDLICPFFCITNSTMAATTSKPPTPERSLLYIHTRSFITGAIAACCKYSNLFL